MASGITDSTKVSPIGSDIQLDEINISGATRGDILYFDGTDWKLLQSAAQGDIIYFDANKDPARLSAGTSGTFLKTNGAGANPSWALASNKHTFNFSISDLLSTDISTHTISGTGSVVAVGQSIELRKTNADAGSVTVAGKAPGQLDQYGQNLFDLNPTFFARVGSNTAFTGLDGDEWIGIGMETNANSLTEKHMGFLIEFDNGTATLYGTNANGTTQTKTELSGVSYTTDTDFNFEAVMTSGSKIEFYVNGSLEGTSTTNIPSGSMGNSAIYSFGIENDAGETINHNFAAGLITVTMDKS